MSFERLWRLPAGEGRLANYSFVGRLAIHCIAQVMVLATMVEALVRGASTGGSARTILVFALAIASTWWAYGRLLRTATRNSVSLAGALDARIVAAVLDCDRCALDDAGRDRIERGLGSTLEQVADAGPLMARLLSEFAVALAVSVYTVSISPLGAGVTFGLVIGVTSLTTLVAHGIRSARVQTAAAQTWASRGLRDLLRGLPQVQQHAGRSAAIAADDQARLERVREARRAYNTAFYRGTSAGRTLFYVAAGLIVFALPLIEPHIAPLVGALLMVQFFVSGTIRFVRTALPTLLASAAALDELSALAESLESKSMRRRRPAAGDVPRGLDETGGAAMALRGVVFRYPADGLRAGFELGPIDLEVRPGEIMLITGENGSGKTTLIDLLLGLRRAEAGALLLDGHATAPDTRWRSRFATVLTTFAVFDRLYGHGDVPRARVDALLAELSLDHVVEYADGRFSTTDLSTGQRKRLMLLVALLQDRRYSWELWIAD